MAIKQISVMLENKQGQLANVIKTISDADINIRALSIAETSSFGMLRLIVSDPDKVKEILDDNAIVVQTDVIAVKMDDEEGSLYKILKVLEDAAINVDYSYAFTASHQNRAYVVFRVGDVAAAEAVLEAKGFTFISNEEI